jgi:cytochrome c oxidase cbb3-type subunit 4
MSFDMNSVRVIVTVVSFLAFVGILAWVAYKPNAGRFEAASRLPFEEGAPSGRSGSAA